jgi:hypothetical protein
VARYVSKRQPAAFIEAPAPQSLPHPTVDSQEPVKTGILDKDGNPIYRLPDPIGYLPSRG